MVTRRTFLVSSVAAGAVLAAPPGLAAATRGPAARSTPLSQDWLFGGPLVPGSTAPDFDDSGFQRITLPHTVTPLSWRRWDNTSWEREWIYRRHFDVPGDLTGRRVFVDFGAALTGATVVLNGTDLGTHLGGYLPFSHEVTGMVQAQDNVLAVALDSRFDVNTPPNRPGEPTVTVDFWQPGGIHREVALRVVPATFLADVFARPVDVLSPSRRVDVACTVDAAAAADGLRVEATLLDGETVVARASAPVAVDAPGQHSVTVGLTDLGDVALWSPESPKLYQVVVRLFAGESAVHDYTTRIGFREARFAADGFYLNGSRRQLFGVNRHEIFPYAGPSMPARAHRRDVEILRQLNCDMVRLSHYPQTVSFVDACDELGVLVFEEVPGWGLYLGDQAWKDLVLRDVRDMVVRDRNHPSIVVWGARLNETLDDELFNRTQELCTGLDPSRQTTGAIIGGMHDTPNFVQDVFSYNDYRVADGHASLLPPRTDRPYLVSEAVGTLSGPAKYYTRTAPVADQQGQAVAHAYVHHIAAGDKRYCGLLSWSGFDYPSGSGNQLEGVKYTGVVDLFREPKPGAALYLAQVDPTVRPVIEPAFYWDFGPGMPDGPGAAAMICANCERLEVFVGGTHHATVTPDRARFGNLRYPPSFVDLSGVGGLPELRVDGYVGAELVLSRSFAADPADDVLSVTVDDEEIDGDGADATRAVFRVLDAHGAARPYVTGDATIEVTGPVDLVGESPFAFEAAGGVGAVWLRARVGESGTARIRVSHGDRTGEATITVRQVGTPRPPVPRVTLTTSAAPSLVAAGATTVVTATLTHDRPISDVQTTLELPPGWTARRAPRSSWQVTAPANARPGEVELVVRASWRSAAGREGRHAFQRLRIPTTFEAARDNVGTSTADGWRDPNFDGVGNSYSREALSATGLTPGGSITDDGTTFTWPSVPPGAPDNVLAAGQTITLTGTGPRLSFLGAASRGPITGTGTVHFADGTTAPYTVKLSDYFYPPTVGDRIVSTMAYINTSNPAKADNGVGGRRTEEVYVFHASAKIPSGDVIGVTLPDVGADVAGGRPGFHIFAMKIG
jgi:beta-galactosidase